MGLSAFERIGIPKEQHCAGRASVLTVVVYCVNGAQSSAYLDSDFLKP